MTVFEMIKRLDDRLTRLMLGLGLDPDTGKPLPDFSNIEDGDGNDINDDRALLPSWVYDEYGDYDEDEISNDRR